MSQISADSQLDGLQGQTDSEGQLKGKAIRRYHVVVLTVAPSKRLENQMLTLLVCGLTSTRPFTLIILRVASPLICLCLTLHWYHNTSRKHRSLY